MALYCPGGVISCSVSHEENIYTALTQDTSLLFFSFHHIFEYLPKTTGSIGAGPTELDTLRHFEVPPGSCAGSECVFDVTDWLTVRLSSPPTACQSSCATCSSRWDCQSCSSQLPLLSADGGQCLASCPPGSYQQDHTHCPREYHRMSCDLLSYWLWISSSEGDVKVSCDVTVIEISM